MSDDEVEILMRAGGGMVSAIEVMLTALPGQMTAASERAVVARDEWFKALRQIVNASRLRETSTKGEP
ncbi:hypothetical protein ACHMW5_13860 [Azospirillum melinis]|uniref:hypothetical protein n=1 Tax=Azospirillum melinis TaxID=328839 RepID=UPI0037565C21